MKSLSSFDKIWQRLVVADVEHYVNVVFVLEVAIEAHNILVEEWAVDLDFACEFLASFTTCEALLRDDFQCPCLTEMIFTLNWWQPWNFVSFRKTALHVSSVKINNDLPFLRSGLSCKWSLVFRHLAHVWMVLVFLQRSIRKMRVKVYGILHQGKHKGPCVTASLPWQGSPI